jgi:hypothetical protein
MAKELSIPLGLLPDAQIKEGLLALTERLQLGLKKELGSAFQITATHVHTQHEVLRDNVTVGLKYIEYNIDLRRELVSGARIRVSWSWSHKEEVRISVSSAALVESRYLKGAMIAALGVSAIAMLSFSFATYGTRMGGIAFFVLFVIFFLLFLIPYPFLKIYCAVRNNDFVAEVSTLSSNVLKSNA